MSDGYVISFIRSVPVTIEHVQCGVTSWNPSDIAHHYCGACHRFLDLFVFDTAQIPGQAALLAMSALRWPDTSDVLAGHPEVLLRIDSRLLRMPEGRPPEWWYVAKDGDGEQIALSQHFMDFIVQITHYLERRLHGG